MALQKYIRQLRPIQENYAAPVIKIQSLLNEINEKEIDSIIKSIGGGKTSEAVFETWVHIVAKLSGNKTTPTSKDIDSILSSEKEINAEGKEWITNFRKKDSKKEEFLIQAIELIGGDVKKIPNINWGNVDVLHKNIKKYYQKVPDTYIQKGSKDNTADMVFVIKGSVSELLSSLPKSTMSWTDKGIISIEGTDLQFIQVSLKKGMENSRIGKLNTLINDIYGQQQNRPSKMIPQEEQGSLEDFMQNEGFFGDIKDFISKGIKAALSFAKKVFSKIRNSLLKTAIKMSKTITKDKMHKSAKNLMKLTGFTITEAAGDDVKINSAMLREMKALKNEIIKKDLVNKEYDTLLSNVGKINSKKKGSITIINNGTNPKLEMKNFTSPADIVLSRGLNSHITREELFPAFKLVSNYASYRTFNAVLSDMFSKLDKFEEATDSLVQLSAKMKAEAMFGNTELPLWIVYGTGGGAHYKHTKKDFTTDTAKEIAKYGESMNVPYMVLEISRSGGKSDYNSIYLHILTGAVKVEDELKPEYVKIQFINRSGSTWSYKIDAMSTSTGVPK